MTDPYGATQLRSRVLAGWTASPARFREDANTEEDHALGGYRDRVVIELAQNAADAATTAGEPGRLRLTLADGVLTAANTGSRLDAAGVSALSTLRASAKIDQTSSVGRFGVGFAAVVSVSDEPMIVSANTEPGAGLNGAGLSGVRWSAARTRELVAEIPSLAEELRRRDGGVPVLRLPFAVAGAAGELGVPPSAFAEGFDTVVRLPLRDPEAEALVRSGLDEVGPALLLALPALRTIEIEVDGASRTLTARRDTSLPGEVTIGGTRWRTCEAGGTLDSALLADRPTEERSRPHWQVRWAIPDIDRSPAQTILGGPVSLPDGVAAVLHAPTPSDEPIGLPALLIASFPLAPDRRHVAPGPLTDFLVERAAETYVRLLRELPADPRLLDLVPGPVAAGELDARLRRGILRGLPEVPLLPRCRAVRPDGRSSGPAEELPDGREAAPGRIRGADAVAVDGPAALVELLAEVLPGLLPANWPVRHRALSALGVRRMELADVVDALAGLDREPAWWRRLYDTLAGADTDALGALPVPLVPASSSWDAGTGAGRMIRGPRGLLIAADGVDPGALAELALRFVHPDAVHPLLARLGAVEAGPREVLADPAVRAAVEGSYDSQEAEEIAEAVLTLVSEARLRPGEETWLADLALPGADGESYPAGELLLPGSPLLDLMVQDAPFGVVSAELVERFGEGPLTAVGVLGTFALVREQDVSLSDLAFDLDGEHDWAQDVLDRLPVQDVPPLVPELTAVRDLELVERWEGALELLARPPLRAAVVDPVYVLHDDGRRTAVPSYTAWWLSGRPVLDGRRPGELRMAGDRLLAGLYDLAPPGLDAQMLRALGVRTSASALLAEPGGAAELLDRLADPGRTVSRGQLRELWTVLAEAVLSDEVLSESVSPGAARSDGSRLGGIGVTPPERLRAVVDGRLEVVAAADALILDSPDLLPLLKGQPLVMVSYEESARLAEVLDLPLATEEISGTVESSGSRRPVPAVTREVLAEAPETYLSHPALWVDGSRVPWRYDGEQVHVDAEAGAGALARGLAWAADRWADRAVTEAALRDPEALPTLLAEADLDP